jgi:hypothetical protein
LWAEAWAERRDALAPAAVRACIAAITSRVVNLPAVPPLCLVDKARWQAKGPRAAHAARGACVHTRRHMHCALTPPPHAGYGLAHPVADSALAVELAVRRALSPLTLVCAVRARSVTWRLATAPHALTSARCVQAYAAYAGSAVNLERSSAAHVAVTVEKSVTTILRFLGYLAHVEASPSPPSLSVVLDGDALARYVAFSLTVRYVLRAAAAAPRLGLASSPLLPFTLGRKGSGSRAASPRTCPLCSCS